MLHAINQALETNSILGRMMGRLEGERWARLCERAGREYYKEYDLSLAMIEDILLALSEESVRAPDSSTPRAVHGT